jgi:hypothetical protein
MMVKTGIDKNERWPVYSLSASEYPVAVAEVDLNTYLRWLRVLKDWEAVQEEMEAYVK